MKQNQTVSNSPLVMIFTHTQKTSNKININITYCFHLSICVPPIYPENIYYVSTMKESTFLNTVLPNASVEEQLHVVRYDFI